EADQTYRPKALAQAPPPVTRAAAARVPGLAGRRSPPGGEAGQAGRDDVRAPALAPVRRTVSSVRVRVVVAERPVHRRRPFRRVDEVPVRVHVPCRRDNRAILGRVRVAGAAKAGRDLALRRLLGARHVGRHLRSLLLRRLGGGGGRGLGGLRCLRGRGLGQVGGLGLGGGGGFLYLRVARDLLAVGDDLVVGA